ncbi:hypothetical protein Q428_03055 [Fervidicella metallireducens AeB]|uniref:Stress-induced protein n=1 Tax=Fervidicella metallireducens AeB TaxID=1403537 RepID=A0A017RX50_9CLOT|nr:YicC/YloC family endoribonuclease [Fervidicella metallireducens]EYE89267.1 hypothetical protein Q428_03055 [Fervidicella metallireducens AeB]
MVKSMTGYGRGESEDSSIGFLVEMKSVNNRYLDMNIRMPKQLNSMEDQIRKYISQRVSRGKVDVYITLEKYSQDDVVINVDEQLAEAYYNAYYSLKGKFNLAEEIGLGLLAKAPDIFTIERKEEDIDYLWSILSKALDQALEMFIDMRNKEGLKLSKDIVQRCDIINKKVLEIEERSPVVVDEYRDKLTQRISEYLREVEIDQARLVNEVAFFADRSNITEEIVRLKSHITQLKDTITAEETVGRKLDFLIQEMNRETNTIGSKANDLLITNLVVDIKSELEKIREQIQNIE